MGIGLGEDTGLLITNNSMMEAIGSGLVILVDGKNYAEGPFDELKKITDPKVKQFFETIA